MRTLTDGDRDVLAELERDARDHDPETCPDCQACEAADAAEYFAWGLHLPQPPAPEAGEKLSDDEYPF